MSLLWAVSSLPLRSEASGHNFSLFTFRFSPLSPLEWPANCAPMPLSQAGCVVPFHVPFHEAPVEEVWLLPPNAASKLCI